MRRIPVARSPWRTFSRHVTNVQTATRQTIGPQTVFSGTPCLSSFVEDMRKSGKRPLIVTDEGVAKNNLLAPFLTACEAARVSPVIAPYTQPNPGINDVIAIAKHFAATSCDSIVGYGGGGPLDAAKAGAALVAAKQSQDGFDVQKDGREFIENIRSFMSKLPAESPWLKNIPPIGAIPTTAGTGSEAGKSAVITDSKGIKRVFGHPGLMPKWVALAPQLTEGLPAPLTAATGLDALFHCIEAFFVTRKEAYLDGCNDADIASTDDFALRGIALILVNLPKAFSNGSNLEARLDMQFAAFYGAKAFRKGSLGGIHATAHSIGALYHIHHGTAVARMSVPVLQYTQDHISGLAAADAKEVKDAYEAVRALFEQHGFTAKDCAAACKLFLKQFKIPNGLSELPVKATDKETLAGMAEADPCQTNPVPLNKQAYQDIFASC